MTAEMGPTLPKIWVVTPVFYDSEPFRRLRSEILEALSADAHFASLETGFVVIDDSAGADADSRHLSAADTRVLAPPFNLGHQRAIVYGLRSIEGELGDADYVVTLDSDGEDQPVDVVRLLDRARSESFNLDMVVLAQRTTRTESRLFRLMYVFFRVFFRVLTGERINSGNFAVQRGWFVARAIGHPSFDLCYSTSLLALRRTKRLVPCARAKRYSGQSRMNSYRLIAHGIRMMLPFAEQMAVRLLTVSAASLGVVVLSTAVGAVLMLTVSVSSSALAAAIVAPLIVGTVTFVGFLTLFSGFAQSSAIAMQGLDLTRESFGAEQS